MKIIKSNEGIKENNSDKCKTIEYSFNDKDIDLGVAIITGRYPENGYCINTISKMLIQVLEGTGTLNFENKEIEFSKGDAILIENNEKYYWKSDYCKVSMICTPAWSKEQYIITE